MSTTRFRVDFFDVNERALVEIELEAFDTVHALQQLQRFIGENPGSLLLSIFIHDHDDQPGVPDERSEAVAYIEDVLGLSVLAASFNDEELARIDAPLIEHDPGNPSQVYVKFMSNGGDLDDTLGRLFTQHCLDRGLHISQRRWRSCHVLSSEFPQLTNSALTL